MAHKRKDIFDMKKITTIVMALVFALVLSTINPGLMLDDGYVTAEDSVVGYAYGGLYWDTDEYEELLSTTAVQQYVVDESAESFCATHSKRLSLDSKSDSAIDSDDELNLEDRNLISEAAYQIGMAIAAGVDEDGNQITYLGGYTFVNEKGTSLGELMNRLEVWAMNKSPYQDLFFSRNWTYKAVKVADGEQSIVIDRENGIVNFNINEKVSELDQWDVLAALRYTVKLDAKAETETVVK